MSKKPKPSNEHPHVWGIFCLAFEKAQKLGKRIDEYLTEKEVEDLSLPSNKIYKLLEEARGKFMIKKFTFYLSQLARKDETMSEELMFLIYRGLR